MEEFTAEMAWKKTCSSESFTEEKHEVFAAIEEAAKKGNNFVIYKSLSAEMQRYLTDPFMGYQVQNLMGSKTNISW
jgi:hypothetical protein